MKISVFNHNEFFLDRSLMVDIDYVLYIDYAFYPMDYLHHTRVMFVSLACHLFVTKPLLVDCYFWILRTQ